MAKAERGERHPPMNERLAKLKKSQEPAGE